MSHSVLVVEDYADLRSAIESTLVRGDYACDTVDSGEAAVSMLRDHHYEAILLSPRLPIANDPVMHFLEEFQPDELTKVVLMFNPGGEDDPDPDHCRVLTKPFNRQELLATVATR
jgi:DNA-binding response OmpR family regulator